MFPAHIFQDHIGVAEQMITCQEFDQEPIMLQQMHNRKEPCIDTSPKKGEVALILPSSPLFCQSG